MLRRALLRRMIFAGLATWFLDLPLPRESDTLHPVYGLSGPTAHRWASVSFPMDDGSLVLVMTDVTDADLDIGDRVTRNISGIERTGTITGLSIWTDPLA